MKFYITSCNYEPVTGYRSVPIQPEISDVRRGGAGVCKSRRLVFLYLMTEIRDVDLEVLVVTNA